MASNSMVQNSLVSTLVGGLTAYASTYGLPETAEQLQSLVGSLISVTDQAETIVANASQAQQLIQTVLANFDPQSLATATLDQAKTSLAEAAHQRRSDLESQVKDTLNAYIQDHAPGLKLDALEDTLTTVVPLVTQGPITRAEVIELMGRVADSFDLATALTAHINPTVVSIAKTVAVALSQKPMEQAVTETVTAYVAKFEPALTTVGEDLIENAIGAILRNRVQFNLDTDLDLANQRLLIQQVSFQLNILQASPPTSKTAEQVAQQIYNEVDRFKQQRAAALNQGDAATGLVSDDGLSISSGWTFTGPEQQVKQQNSESSTPP